MVDFHTKLPAGFNPTFPSFPTIGPLSDLGGVGGVNLRWWVGDIFQPRNFTFFSRECEAKPLFYHWKSWIGGWSQGICNGSLEVQVMWATKKSSWILTSHYIRSPVIKGGMKLSPKNVQNLCYIPLNPGCLIRILMSWFMTSIPHKRVGNHPLYALNNQGALFSLLYKLYTYKYM